MTARRIVSAWFPLNQLLNNLRAVSRLSRRAGSLPQTLASSRNVGGVMAELYSGNNWQPIQRVGSVGVPNELVDPPRVPV